MKTCIPEKISKQNSKKTNRCESKTCEYRKQVYIVANISINMYCVDLNNTFQDKNRQYYSIYIVEYKQLRKSTLYVHVHVHVHNYGLLFDGSGNKRATSTHLHHTHMYRYSTPNTSCMHMHNMVCTQRKYIVHV